jgi:hypothetical protein
LKLSGVHKRGIPGDSLGKCRMVQEPKMGAQIWESEKNFQLIIIFVWSL